MYLSIMALPNSALTSPPTQRKLPKASFEAAPALPRTSRSSAVEAGGEDSDKKRKNRRPEAEKGGDHREQFDIAKTHAFAVANRFVEPANEEQQKRRSADGGDSAEDQSFGSGQKDVAVAGKAARDC